LHLLLEPRARNNLDRIRHNSDAPIPKRT
jgi:hypothetical protein